MRSPTDIIEGWNKIPLEGNSWRDLNFTKLITDAFDLPEDDDYEYVVEGFSMSLKEIQEKLDSALWKYQYSFGHGAIPVRSSPYDRNDALTTYRYRMVILEIIRKCSCHPPILRIV